MYKDNLIKAIKIVAETLNSHSINYIIGGSGSLMVHGLDVLPNDLDIVVDPKDYKKATEILKTPTMIEGIRCETLSFTIDSQKICEVLFYGVPVKVNQLIEEYKYYKSRTDKVEQNRQKIKLIEKALGIQN